MSDKPAADAMHSGIFAAAELEYNCMRLCWC